MVMKKAWIIVLALKAALVLQLVDMSECSLFPGSRIVLKNELKRESLYVQCWDALEGGWLHKEKLELKPGASETFKLNWITTQFIETNINCRLWHRGLKKPCPLNIYDTHLHYYECMDKGCKWAVNLKFIYFTSYELPTLLKYSWCK